MDQFKYYHDEFQRLISVVEKYPITMEQIVRCAECLGKISVSGKLPIYYRVLFDGSQVL